MTPTEKYQDYLKQLRKPFIKVCRARFLNPDGSTAFSVDNIAGIDRNKALIENSGTFNCNFQNGRRRSMPLTFARIGDTFDYDNNAVWFGTEIAWEEGLILSDGTPFYIPQAVFVVENPQEVIAAAEKGISYELADKWANLDGGLFGNLENTYMAEEGINIFEPIAALLKEDRGNGRPLDSTTPIFTEYYNDKIQVLPDGTSVSLTDAPYSLTVEPGTKADVILGFASMLNAWVGYDPSGALRVEPSQDDILDATKPVQWEFSEDETNIIGLTYDVRNTDVYNDVIVMGQQLEDHSQPAARAQNLDPASDTNIKAIGRKTVRFPSNGFFTDQQCIDFAEWKLKRVTVLQKAVTISCPQIMHIQPNQLITIVRTDKPGHPRERHLVMGFSRPVSGTEMMTINCVSVNDFPVATVSTWNGDGQEFLKTAILTQFKHAVNVNGAKQGSCTDGTYIYQMCANSSGIYDTIIKFNIETGAYTTKTFQSSEINFGHGNDMAYNNINGCIYITTMLEDGAVVVLNASDLTYVKTLYALDQNRNPYKCWSLCYDRYRRRFYSGHGSEYIVYDANMNYVSSFTMPKHPDATGQSCETDGEYIYRLTYNPNYVDVATVSGEYVITINLPQTAEPEGIMYDWKGRFYMSTNSTGYIYYDLKMKG